MDTKLKLRFEQHPNILKIPKRFERLIGIDIENKDMKELIDHYINNFEKFYYEGKAPAFFGPAGVGKTTAAAIIAYKLHYEREKTLGMGYAVPILWADTVTTLHTVIDLRDYRDPSYFDYKKSLMRTPVVIFDDFGQLQKFERIRELFFEIVNYRFANLKPTIFTASFNVGTGQTKWRELDDCFGPALTRRILTMAEGLIFIP